ncbi:protease inhibitor I9 family protein [Longibacter sp.]|uniref:protease inhibitor I9 family protein n=1 Tax=Longibacter sp. TaxID=2045415 RepID=UPI003EB87B23
MMSTILKRGVPCALLALLFVFTACDDGTPVSTPTAESPTPATYSSSKSGSDVIPGQYIVVFKDGVHRLRSRAQALAKAHSGEVGFIYETAFQGFSIRASEQAANALTNNPDAAYVEPDQRVQAIGTQSPTTWGPTDRTSETCRSTTATRTVPRAPV